MQYGLFSMNAYACAEPETAARIARLAEDAGFESLWAGEHVVLPDPRVPPSPMEPEDPILDPVVALTFLAGQTRRVRLGTGIIILPQRNPLVLAKELASLDVLSGGRLIVGLGAGYLEPEFRALGASFEDRGARMDAYMGAMRAIWSGEHAFEGAYAPFSGVTARPMPVQQSGPPLVVGGHTLPAFRRAVRSASGWYGFALDLDRTKQCLDALRRVAEQVERPAELGDLEISVTPRGHVSAEMAEQFAALSVHRLVLNPPRDASAIEGYVERGARELIRAV